MMNKSEIRDKALGNKKILNEKKKYSTPIRPFCASKLSTFSASIFFKH